VTSIRNKLTGRRTRDDAVLDAARACVLAVGVRRTTLTDIARRAGISRMTIYRRWPDVQSLVGDLMTREWLAVVSPTVPRGDGRPIRPRLVASLLDGTRSLREHPLFRKIIEVDPELLLPYLLERRGASQEAMLTVLERAVRAGHRDGTVRPDHPSRQARTILLIAQSFTMSAHTMTDDTDPALSAAAFHEELRQILERYLTP
jgi:AcrR family transcriptional regulator